MSAFAFTIQPKMVPSASVWVGASCALLPSLNIRQASVLSSSHTGLFRVPQIFVGEPRDEETEVCFMDIAYDEVPERHYKESEVSGVRSLMSRCSEDKGT